MNIETIEPELNFTTLQCYIVILFLRFRHTPILSGVLQKNNDRALWPRKADNNPNQDNRKQLT